MADLKRHLGQSARNGIRLSAFALCLLSPTAYAMDYALVPLRVGNCAAACPSAIFASGTINAREAESFARFMQHAGSDRRLARLLIVHSPGGNAYGGIALGSMIRRLGMDVVVARPSGNPEVRRTALQKGLCGSACVFVLAGGSKRIVPPGSTVAVHRARHIGADVHDPLRGQREQKVLTRDEIIRMFGDYYASMGIARELARLGEQTPHQQARFLSRSEIRRFRLAGPKL